MDVYNDNEEVLFEAKSSVRGLLTWANPFAYLRMWSSQFTLTNERLTLSRGIVGKQIDEVELYRIKDTKVSQGVFQRMFGTGDVMVVSDDNTDDFIMKNITSPKKKRELIRKMSNKARKDNNVRIVTN